MDITPIGITTFRNQKKVFGIKKDDRRRHIYIIGKTGVGKTTLLENMAVWDIQNGNGVGVIDPHGEFADKLLDYIPSNRINDVIYFNPADIEYPIGFNVLENVDPETRHLVAAGVMSVFKKIWPDVWSPRMEYILNNAILALLEYPGSTLLGIMRILSDKEFRNKIVNRLTDPVVKSFWVDEFAEYSKQFATEAVAAIQNKVGQFITASIIRNIIGQTRTAFDLREIMDKKKILIVNLSKGKLGEDVSKLLGGLIITKLYLAAMSRVDIPEEQRNDFYLYVDEFQNFANESFANILSEARKYRLSLILAHQYIAQLYSEKMGTTLRDAIFGNVGTIIAFRVGAEDAEFLEKEFSPIFTMNDIINLPKYNIYIKLMIDGIVTDPFSAHTLPSPQKLKKSNRNKIIKQSRYNFALSKKEIEAKINKWAGFETEENQILKENLPSKEDRKKKPEIKQKEEIDVSSSEKKGHPLVKLTQKFFAACWKCNGAVKVPFQPDGKRPVFCKKCFKKSQNLKAKGIIPTLSSYLFYDDKNQRLLTDIKLTPKSANLDILQKIKEEIEQSDIKQKKEVTPKEELKKVLSEILSNKKNIKSTNNLTKDTTIDQNQEPEEVIAASKSLNDNKKKILKPGQTIKLK